MKIITKTIMILSLASTFAAAEQQQDMIDNMQQKTNIILIEKIKILENKVEDLNALEEKNRIVIQDLKKTIGNDIAQNNENILKVENNTKENKTDKEIKQYKNIYMLKQDCIAKKGSYKKRFKKGSYIKIIQTKKDKGLTSSGFWIEAKCYKKIDNSSLQKGDLYKINTYMANSREKPGVKNNVESVFMKNDIIYITDIDTAPDGGKWGNIQNDGYINMRIIKKLKIEKK